MANNWRFSIIVSTVVALGLSTDVQAGGKPSKLGPKIGSKAPEFALKDQYGKVRKLDELLRKGHVAFVFYRSVVW